MKASSAAVGFENKFTAPPGSKQVQVWGFASSWATPLFHQSVGQDSPLLTLTGKPDVQRASPVSCHPPMKASSTRLGLPKNALPFPKGSSATQSALIW